jgi:CDP-glucose 4,6-dehydratase
MHNDTYFELIKKKFNNKKILITGNTGFKGVWLTKVLQEYSTKLYGISYKKNFANDTLYKKIKKYLKIKTFNLDISDEKKFNKLIKKINPDYIFHFAAQSLVLKSWDLPLFNFDSNVKGSISLMKSIPFLKKLKGTLLITTDKVYLNNYKNKKFIEEDPLGGNDPYSSSKVISDLIFQYFINYIYKKNNNFSIIRSGNVYGGGDFAENRLISDYYKSKKKVIIRNPKSTRPYQFILDVIFFYLLIMIKNQSNSIWNVGPKKSENSLSIIKKLNLINNFRKKIFIKKNSIKNLEKSFLSLSTKKIEKFLKYNFQIDIDKGLKLTDSINSSFNKKSKIINKIINQQIENYKKNKNV